MQLLIPEKKKKKQVMNERLVDEKMLLDPNVGTQGADSNSFEGDVDEPESLDSDMDSCEKHGDSTNNSTWTAYQDDDGMIYYHNYFTGESSWDPPPGFGDSNIVGKSSSEDLASACGSDEYVQQEENDGSEDFGFTQVPLQDDGSTLEPNDDEEANELAEHEETEHEVHDTYEQSFQTVITDETADSSLDCIKDDKESHPTNTVEGSGLDEGVDISKADTPSLPPNIANEGSSSKTSNIHEEIADKKTEDEHLRLTSADYDLD